jgi:Cu+-exporting ATPase
MNVKDPVCGMEVEDQQAAASMNYQGQTYYFCCQGCQGQFEKDPEAYLKDNAGEGHQAHHH